ncbi:flagellar hook-associated protein FlgK [Bythopirellula polymerisocia]|uniref:Flagellar hook-associated protein 1 n=2 Tax=Bythopirellula polymerisocia TaxID=2528003 RepID=A0A5C6CPZ2_9BACT|nr:flagellar hook-associated protein FlgK [Bythopirellula polymerisocia]
MAGNTLSAMQIGLHVVGNNIANANTPGYVRERAIFTPAPVQRIGNLTLGLGVQVAGIEQVIDKFVETRLRDAGSDLASAEVQEKVFNDLQAIIGELTDVDISSALTQFFNGIENVTDGPENIGIRDLVVKDGVSLTQRINSLDRRVEVINADLSSRVQSIATEINTLTEQIRKLNLQIVTTEGGGTTGSDAGGLRSQRAVALTKLANLVDIKATEGKTGSVNISLNGELLVFDGTSRQVEAASVNVNGVNATRIRFVDNKSSLQVNGGELHGVYEARDNVLGSFLESFDQFAATLAFEFNKLYSQGQGLEGFNEITSAARVDDPDAALNQAGLNFTTTSGSFQVLIRNKKDDITKTHDIRIDLNGLDGNDTTLHSLAAKLDSIDGLSATVNLDNRLVLSSETDDIDFSFGIESPENESGALAALGINTFFTGSKAGDLEVNGQLRSGSRAGAKFAASTQGINEGTQNALRLVALYDDSLTTLDGSSIRGIYDTIINDTTQGATISAAVADGFRVFAGTLEASAQGVSGVNLDEEAIDMITLQRTYQASARYISTLAELLDTMINL